MRENEYPKGLRGFIGIGAIVSALFIGSFYGLVESNRYKIEIDEAILNSDVDNNGSLDKAEQRLVYKKLGVSYPEDGRETFNESLLKRYIESHSVFN